MLTCIALFYIPETLHVCRAVQQCVLLPSGTCVAAAGACVLAILALQCHEHFLHACCATQGMWCNPPAVSLHQWCADAAPTPLLLPYMSCWHAVAVWVSAAAFWVASTAPASATGTVGGLPSIMKMPVGQQLLPVHTVCCHLTERHRRCPYLLTQGGWVCCGCADQSPWLRLHCCRTHMRT
jgi:hypothetical protein